MFWHPLDAAPVTSRAPPIEAIGKVPFGLKSVRTNIRIRRVPSWLRVARADRCRDDGSRSISWSSAISSAASAHLVLHAVQEFDGRCPAGDHGDAERCRLGLCGRRPLGGHEVRAPAAADLGAPQSSASGM